MIKLKTIFVFSILLFFSYADANNCLIKDGKINGLGVGDSKEKIFLTFSPKYQIVEEKRPNYVPTVILYQDKKKIITFEIDSDKNEIFFISVYDNCVTNENIGIGSTLSDAVKVYGKGAIEPADEGYLIYFDRIKGMSFLLDNAKIPKRLRNIPDDAFKENQEKEILSLKDLKIKGIKIYGIYGN